jgi:hypothetical protein
MRFWTLLALAAALAAPAALPAHAAEKPLTRDGLLAVLKSDQVWCSGWRGADQSCEDIAFLDVLPGNKIRQVSRYRMSTEPNLQMVVRETVNVEGAALCSIFRFDDLDIVVLMDDQPARRNRPRRSWRSWPSPWPASRARSPVRPMSATRPPAS